MKKLNSKRICIRNWFSESQFFVCSFNLNLFRKSLCFLFCIVFFFSGCKKSSNNDLSSKSWAEAGLNTGSSVSPGISAFNGSEINYIRDGKTILNVQLNAPTIAGVATQPEGWGYFQFPSIYRSNGGAIVVTWHLAADAVTSYGQGNYNFAISNDGCKSWKPGTGNPPIGGGFLLPNGDVIGISTPKAIDVGTLNLPLPVGSVTAADGGYFAFYKLTELPNVLQGVYLSRRAIGATTAVGEHATLDDPKAVRYPVSGLFPVVWWGDMHLATDGSIIAGIYPGFCLNDNGGVDPAGVPFYRSTDNGHSWKIQGRIPYIPDLQTDSNGNKRLALGFTEPAFEILSDGTYVCVMRTTDSFGNSPMYISRSTDLGVTWTKPETFTRSGVLPRLLQLSNGVLVMASGRPGVQLRFSMDGKGQKWTDPFEMLPWDNEKQTVSCGYTEVIATGPNSFLLAYSDFNYQTKAGVMRKAIKVREVFVTPK